MPIVLRITLCVVSVITAIFVFRKIKKSQFHIGDTLYWLFFCLMLLIMSIFPQLVYWVSDLLKIESPANFVFVAVIFLLLIKLFLLSVEISELRTKLNSMAQKYGIDENIRRSR